MINLEIETSCDTAPQSLDRSVSPNRYIDISNRYQGKGDQNVRNDIDDDYHVDGYRNDDRQIDKDDSEESSYSSSIDEVFTRRISPPLG